MGSHVQNYGTYQQPNYSTSTALLLEVSRVVKEAWGLEFSLAVASDIGTQYGNSFGTYLRIAKTGLLTKY